MVNADPVAAISTNVVSGQGPLTVDFDGRGSRDPDNSPQALSYQWDFGDGGSSNETNPRYVFTANGRYNVTLTVSDGLDTDTATLTITVADPVAPTARADNPFKDVRFYVDPAWSAKASAEPGGAAIANTNTAVWMDRIGAITDGIGLKGHLDQALDQGAGMFMFVVYDLPNRDCAALASNGELRIAQNGFQRYQDEYIKPIVDIVSDPKYAGIRIVAIIEVDSLPNLVTNLEVADCKEADGPGGYRDGVRYALNQLSKVPNVYSYLDIAHSGWLGWSDNFSSAVSLISDVIKSTDAGWDSVNGFVSNTANYTPTVEPFMTDANLSVGGQQVKSSAFYAYNNYLDEKSFVQDWRDAMIRSGAPTSIGMLIDTSRNGWGGPARPQQGSRSQNVASFVSESKVDRRAHRGNWCNQPGGIGFKPWAEPYPGVDAFVWVKPPGESDGVSDPNFVQDPNDPAKRHDPMCDPNGTNRYESQFSNDSMPNGPHAGRWFPEQFKVLLENAYPAVSEPAGPPAEQASRQDCPGLTPASPVVIAKGARGTLDLGCNAPIYVRFEPAIDRSLFVENTGGEFDITIKLSKGTRNASGHFQSLEAAGESSAIVTRKGKSTRIQLRPE